MDNKEICIGQAIKSKRLKNINLEVIFIDNLLNECICTELFSHDVKQIKVKFDDIEV